MCPWPELHVGPACPSSVSITLKHSRRKVYSAHKNMVGTNWNYESSFLQTSGYYEGNFGLRETVPFGT